MKVAITSRGNTPDALLDQRFGRCNYFVVHDSQTGSIEYIPNPGKVLEEGAGPAAVELLSSRKVMMIISGEFGIKIKPILDSLNVQLIIIKDRERTVGGIIQMLNHKKL